MNPGEFMTTQEYYRKRAEYEKSLAYHMSLKARKVLHPILLCLIMLKNRFSGFKIIKLHDKVDKTDKPIIFCITHIGKFDIEICSEILKKHYYLLSGDFENLHGTLEGNLIELNGVIYLNKNDKDDKERSKTECIEKLKNGGNIMWFPEGIWNLSPNQCVLPIPYGIIKVAIKANAVIVPVAIEQYSKVFYVNIGSNFYFDNYKDKYSEAAELKLAAITDLRDILATLKYEIWDKQPQNKRCQIKDDYFETFVNERLREWHGFTLSDVKAREFRPKGIEDFDKAFEHISKLQPSFSNAFLFDKRNHN